MDTITSNSNNPSLINFYEFKEMTIFNNIFWYQNEYKYQQPFDTYICLHIPFQFFAVTSPYFAETYNFVEHHQCMVLIAFYFNFYFFFFVCLFIFTSLSLITKGIDWNGRSVLYLVVVMPSKRTTLNKTIFSMKYNIINKELYHISW